MGSSPTPGGPVLAEDGFDGGQQRVTELRSSPTAEGQCWPSVTASMPSRVRWLRSSPTPEGQYWARGGPRKGLCTWTLRSSAGREARCWLLVTWIDRNERNERNERRGCDPDRPTEGRCWSTGCSARSGPCRCCDPRRPRRTGAGCWPRHRVSRSCDVAILADPEGRCQHV